MNWNFMTGWPMRKNTLERGLFGLMIMIMTSAYATETEDTPPSEALLDFMMSWETGDQQWVDPFELDEIESEELDKQNVEGEENE